MAVRPRRHRTWLQRGLLFLGVALVMSCLGAASAVGYFYWKTGKLVQYHDVTVTEAAPLDPQNYLVVGSDSRDNIDPNDPDAAAFTGEAVDGKRSDTIMIVRVDPPTHTAKILSLPRDLWVPIPGHGTGRINSAYGYSRQTLIDTIQQNFGIVINHYIEVDFLAFRGVVNAIGGVPMYFDTPVRDGNSGLSITTAGCVRLDGDQALAFARARHLEFKNTKGKWVSDPTGDLGRITRQQFLVRTALHLAFGHEHNLLTVNDLIDVALKNVGVDTGLDQGDLRALAKTFNDFKDEELTTLSLPVEGFRTPAGAAVLRLVEPGAQQAINQFRGLAPGTVSEGEVSVAVRNGSGVTKQATDVAAALQAVGFGASTGRDSSTHYYRTTIEYAPGSEFAADLLARHLTSQAVLVANPHLEANQLTLITGSDFTTVMQQPYAATTTTTAPPATTAPPSTTAGAGATTTSAPVDAGPTTTVLGHTPGVAPDGTVCT